MFKRFIVIAATAVCLIAAALLIFGFTKDQSGPPVGNSLKTKPGVSAMKIAPPKISFPPYPHGKPLAEK